MTRTNDRASALGRGVVGHVITWSAEVEVPLPGQADEVAGNEIRVNYDERADTTKR